MIWALRGIEKRETCANLRSVNYSSGQETFVSKVMFLLFNTLSRFVIVFFFFSKKQASFNLMAGIQFGSVQSLSRV